jgi:hypothetical protein
MNTESQYQNPESTTGEVQSEEESTSITTGVSEMISPTKPPSSEQPWQEWVDVVVDFLSKVPEQIASFFSDYQQPLTTLGLIITAAITVYITLSILDAIGNIPLLSSMLELVGLGYTVWFVTRYLLKASTRQELLAEFDAFKEQILGNKSSGA